MIRNATRCLKRAICATARSVANYNHRFIKEIGLIQIYALQILRHQKGFAKIYSFILIITMEIFIDVTLLQFNCVVNQRIQTTDANSRSYLRVK